MNENILNRGFLDNTHNKLEELLPGEAQWSEAIKVIDSADLPDNQKVLLNANTINQTAVCYLGTDL